MTSKGWKAIYLGAVHYTERWAIHAAGFTPTTNAWEQTRSD